MTLKVLDDEGAAAHCDPDFDPVAEGARFQLSSETALALWQYVSRQLAGYGSRNVQLNRQCFCEAAARVATHPQRSPESFSIRASGTKR